MDLIIIGGKSSFFVFPRISFFRISLLLKHSADDFWFQPIAIKLLRLTWPDVPFSCSVVQVMSDSCDSAGCSLPDSPVRGIFQARILEWAAISFSRVFHNTGGKDSKDHIFRTQWVWTLASVPRHHLQAPAFPSLSGSSHGQLYVTRRCDGIKETSPNQGQI